MTTFRAFAIKGSHAGRDIGVEGAPWRAIAAKAACTRRAPAPRRRWRQRAYAASSHVSRSSSLMRESPPAERAASGSPQRVALKQLVTRESIRKRSALCRQRNRRNRKIAASAPPLRGLLAMTPYLLAVTAIPQARERQSYYSLRFCFVAHVVSYGAVLSPDRSKLSGSSTRGGGFMNGKLMKT